MNIRNLSFFLEQRQEHYRVGVALWVITYKLAMIMNLTDTGLGRITWFLAIALYISVLIIFYSQLTKWRLGKIIIIISSWAEFNVHSNPPEINHSRVKSYVRSQNVVQVGKYLRSQILPPFLNIRSLWLIWGD